MCVLNCIFNSQNSKRKGLPEHRVLLQNAHKTVVLPTRTQSWGGQHASDLWRSLGCPVVKAASPSPPGLHLWSRGAHLDGAPAGRGPSANHAPADPVTAPATNRSAGQHERTMLPCQADGLSAGSRRFLPLGAPSSRCMCNLWMRCPALKQAAPVPTHAELPNFRFPLAS